MNQTEMLHQMCHEVLTEADIRAICKNRGLVKLAASSRPMLESLFLSDVGVEAALAKLERAEIALLYLLQCRDQPVDIAFFRPLEPGRKFGTFSRRYQAVFSHVKDRLVRAGVLLVALAPEGSGEKKMERWRFALPERFARFLPALVESARPLDGVGDYRADVARAKLKTLLDQKAGGTTKDDRVAIVHGELSWDGRPFQVERVVEWRKIQWRRETTPAKYPIVADTYSLPPADTYSLSPADAVLLVLADLKPGFWCDANSLAEPLRVLCGAKVDAEAACASGWRWGFLARQVAKDRTWYRLAPTVTADVPPDRYLTVMGNEGVAVDLDAVPYEALEILTRMSDPRLVPGARPYLLLTPNLAKLGRVFERVAELSPADWLQRNAPAFQQALASASERRGKTILHENLCCARVGDLNLKIALENALAGRIVPLGEEFIAFPTGAVDEVKRLVAKLGFVVKEVATNET